LKTENIDLYAKILSHDQDMTNFGTSEPPIVGWDSLKKIIEDQNAALSQTKIIASDLAIHISKEGDFAVGQKAGCRCRLGTSGQVSPGTGLVSD